MRFRVSECKPWDSTLSAEACHKYVLGRFDVVRQTCWACREDNHQEGCDEALAALAAAQRWRHTGEKMQHASSVPVLVNKALVGARRQDFKAADWGPCKPAGDPTWRMSEL